MSKKGPELEDLEKSHPAHIEKREKACPAENAKGVVALPPDGCKSVGLQEQGHCQSELKGTGMGQNEERLSGFLGSTGQDHGSLWL